MKQRSKRARMWPLRPQEKTNSLQKSSVYYTGRSGSDRTTNGTVFRSLRGGCIRGCYVCDGLSAVWGEGGGTRKFITESEPEHETRETLDVTFTRVTQFYTMQSAFKFTSHDHDFPLHLVSSSVGGGTAVRGCVR
jgi:hypothetical protein